MPDIAGALMLIWVIWMPLHFYCQARGPKALPLVFQAAGTMVAVWITGQAFFDQPVGDDIYFL